MSILFILSIAFMTLSDFSVSLAVMVMIEKDLMNATPASLPGEQDGSENG